MYEQYNLNQKNNSKIINDHWFFDYIRIEPVSVVDHYYHAKSFSIDTKVNNEITSKTCQISDKPNKENSSFLNIDDCLIQIIIENNYLEPLIKFSSFSYKEFLINFESLKKFNYIQVNDEGFLVATFKSDLKPNLEKKNGLQKYIESLSKEKLYSLFLQDTLSLKNNSIAKNIKI